MSFPPLANEPTTRKFNIDQSVKANPYTVERLTSESMNHNEKLMLLFQDNEHSLVSCLYVIVVHPKNEGYFLCATEKEDDYFDYMHNKILSSKLLSIVW